MEGTEITAGFRIKKITPLQPAIYLIVVKEKTAGERLPFHSWLIEK